MVKILVLATLLVTQIHVHRIPGDEISNYYLFVKMNTKFRNVTELDDQP